MILENKIAKILICEIYVPQKFVCIWYLARVTQENQIESQFKSLGNLAIQSMFNKMKICLSALSFSSLEDEKVKNLVYVA